MTDPAVEAAHRTQLLAGIPPRVAANLGAREALKPIRGWYEELAETYKDGCTGNALIVKGFLEELAPLIYTTEEMAR